MSVRRTQLPEMDELNQETQRGLYLYGLLFGFHIFRLGCTELSNSFVLLIGVHE